MAKRATTEKSDNAGNKQPAPETFEAALEELEAIVGKMESGDVALDESLRLYERGTFLIGNCQDRLDTAEKQIQKLTSKGGKLDGEPLDEDELR